VKTDPTLWIIARATGVGAYLMLSATVLAGLVLRTRVLARRVAPPVAMDLHRTLSLLGLGAIGLHGLALVFDTSVPLPAGALLIPGLAPYRPFWTGLGVVAAELTVLVLVSFAVRRLIGVRTWRRLHWLTYAIFTLATAHGLAAGTDSAMPWALGMYAGAVGLVAVATAWRIMSPARVPVPRGGPIARQAPSEVRVR
jgi:sulfoxide reductase heme-binding subunit YedZ